MRHAAIVNFDNHKDVSIGVIPTHWRKPVQVIKNRPGQQHLAPLSPTNGINFKDVNTTAISGEIVAPYSSYSVICSIFPCLHLFMARCELREGFLIGGANYCFIEAD